MLTTMSILVAAMVVVAGFFLVDQRHQRRAMQPDQDDAVHRAPLRQPAAHDDLDDGADLTF